MHQTKHTLLLLLTAFIWGIAFVAQSVGMDYVGPFTFTASRSIIGAIVLIPCIFLLDRLKATDEVCARKPSNQKTLLVGGVCCGIALAIATMLQQYGIAQTTVGKAGFITALYIVIVPILGIFMKRKPKLRVWLSVLLAIAGLYFLCLTESLSFTKGDTLVLLSAVVFSFHILIIDHFSPLVDGVRMSCIQFAVEGILCTVPALIFEHPSPASLVAAAAPILYAGVLSSGVGYTLQIIAQKDYDPTVASLILSLESVFSVLAGWVILHETLSLKEMFGCILMFGAILLVQLPDKNSNSTH